MWNYHLQRDCTIVVLFMFIIHLIFFFFFFLVSGPVEADPEYKLIVEANNMTVEIDTEISKLIIDAFK